MSYEDDAVLRKLIHAPQLDEDAVVRQGRVCGVFGTVIRAKIPDARIGQRCRIGRRGLDDLVAEVVGFDEDAVTLMPFGKVESVAAGAAIHPFASVPTVPCGQAVRGRVLDALGRPRDGLGELDAKAYAALSASPPDPMTRQRITTPLSTGVRCIDSLLTVGRGQRVGIFAPAGGGKSTLLAMLARYVQADAVVLALIGERGREVEPFIADNLGEDARKKSTVVVSTSDEPALQRLKAAYAATAIAEALRSEGNHVVLLMDSITRFARALRETALAAGELPVRRAYPPSVYAELPMLLERSGNDHRGSITAFYTILVEGELEDDPIAEEAKSLLDGHIVLSDKLGQRGQWPAIDVLKSKSRLMNEIVSEEHGAAAREALAILATYDQNAAKIELGIYEAGSNKEIDTAVKYAPGLWAFLRQEWRCGASLEESVSGLRERLSMEDRP